MRVAIAGGGIGGLAAALFLHARGIRVQVFEAVSEIRELGVGINIQPHSVRELASIGLQQQVEASGNSCLEWALFNRFGQTIWREPRGTAAGHDWPQVSIHRGRLQGVLLDAVRARIGPEAVRTDRRLLDWQDHDDRVVAHFVAADGTEEHVTADALVGADGIHSTLRRKLYPDEGNPLFAGTILWRGMTRTVPFFAGHTMIFAGYNEQKLIAYPIEPPGPDGTAMVNWIAELHTSHMANREDWNRPGRLDDFLPAYQDWRFPWLDVPALIRGAEAVYEYPMVDRDPLPKWSFGRVTLLGDAAHPMYPIGANGASQAIRDGSAVAEALAEGDPTRGLQTYEAARREATSQIVLSNRGLGPEQVMQWAHERAPNGFDDIEQVIPRADLEEVSRRYRTVTWASREERPGALPLDPAKDSRP